MGLPLPVGLRCATELRGELREPPVPFVHRQGVLGGAGQAHRHVRAEVEGEVVPAAVGHWAHRQVGPVGELLGDELVDQVGLDAETGRYWAKVVGGTHSRGPGSGSAVAVWTASSSWIMVTRLADGAAFPTRIPRFATSP